MDFVLALHSHLPYVLNHGRWPHGSDWLCEAALDTYLPLIEQLRALESEKVPAPVTLGVTPVLANQLANPAFVAEMEAFFAQRLLVLRRGAGLARLDRRRPPAARWSSSGASGSPVCAGSSTTSAATSSPRCAHWRARG